MREQPARVLHIIVGLGNGGAEKSLAKICLEDKKNLHEIVSLTTQGHYGKLLRDAGIPVVAVRFRIRRVLKVILALRRLIRRRSPDIIHSWMPHGILFGWLATLSLRKRHRPAAVWGLRAQDYGKRKGIFSLPDLVQLIALVSWVTDPIILAVGSEVKRRHAALGFDVKKIRVIENGYSEESRMAPTRASIAAYQLGKLKAEKRFVIGCVARFHPQKNHFGFLDALGTLALAGHQFLAVFAGEGMTPENEELRKYVTHKNLDDYVFFAGAIDDPNFLYSLMSIHVLPSAFGEGFPNAVAESMLSGVPNVVTDVGDARRLVFGAGWVVPPGDPEALVAALKEAMGEEPSTLRRFGVRAKTQILEDFPEHAMISRYSGVYREALGQATAK